MNQNAISRLESPNYGKATLTTLRRIAKTFDIAILVRFVPFSQMADWVSGTPHLDLGLSPESLRLPSFSQEYEIRPQLGSVEAETDEIDVLSGLRPRRGIGGFVASRELRGAAGAAA
jgi:hypothetical protein